MMYDHDVKSNPQLHDSTETANPDNIDMGGSSQHTDEKMPGDELSIIDSSSSMEDDERYDSDVLHYVLKKLL